jgi:hypothetical protein
MALDHYIPQVHLKNFYSPTLGVEYMPSAKRISLSFRVHREMFAELSRAIPIPTYPTAV